MRGRQGKGVNNVPLLQEIHALRGSSRGGGETRGDSSDSEELVSKIKALRAHAQPRTRTCQQAVLRCHVEACGKAPLYYYDKVTPVDKAGGVPWSACVHVNGKCVCGGTLVRQVWVLTSATCMEGVR